jgi:hypothetical protein
LACHHDERKCAGNRGQRGAGVLGQIQAENAEDHCDDGCNKRNGGADGELREKR